MNSLLTRDGSITFHSVRYDEDYHSVSAGALTEALVKFVEPCNLRPGAVVLDVGFGLGYTALMAIHKAGQIRIISLENDLAVLEAIQSIVLPDDLEQDYRKVKLAAKSLHYKDDDVELKIILGNMLETVSSISGSFDAVFFDPFSPRKQPEIWTQDFFAGIKALMKPGAILTTYSCAGHVRRSLKALGFEVHDGPILGRRSAGTVAVSPPR